MEIDASLLTIVLWLLLIINLGVFLLYGYDKFAAKAFPVSMRIPENTLIAASLLLAFPGAQLGRWVFHHKTRDEVFKHKYYRSLIIEGVILLLLLLVAVPMLLRWFA